MNTLSSSEHEALFNDINNRMASSRLSKRHSRSSGMQTPNRASARIEKPRSTNPSPRRIERRRTTASVKPYVSLDDHYNAMFGPGKTYDDASDIITTRHQPETMLARPMSWHPTSFQVSQPVIPSVRDLPSTVFIADARTKHNIIHSNAVNGLALECSRPQKSTRSEMFSYMGQSKDDISNTLRPQPSAASQTTRASWCVAPNTFTPIPYSQAYVPLGIDPFYSSLEQVPPQLTTHFGGTEAQRAIETEQFTIIDSAAEADDFLPMQRPPSRVSSSPVLGHKDPPSRAINTEEDYPLRSLTSLDPNQQELVGMGLYDAPEGDSIFPTGLPQEAKGKGLKLEETWKPPRGLLLPKDHEEQDDASSDSGSSVCVDTKTDDNDRNDDLLMGEDMGVLTIPTQGNSFYLPPQLPPPPPPTSSCVAPALAYIPADFANVLPVAEAPVEASAGIAPVSASTHVPMFAAAQVPPPSLAGRSFFFDENDDNVVNRGMDMWYAQLRPAMQTAMLGTPWF